MQGLFCSRSRALSPFFLFLTVSCVLMQVYDTPRSFHYNIKSLYLLCSPRTDEKQVCTLSPLKPVICMCGRTNVLRFTVLCCSAVRCVRMH
jgi:hypothetical protein